MPFSFIRDHDGLLSLEKEDFFGVYESYDSDLGSSPCDDTAASVTFLELQRVTIDGKKCVTVSFMIIGMSRQLGSC